MAIPAVRHVPIRMAGAAQWLLIKSSRRRVLRFLPKRRRRAGIERIGANPFFHAVIDGGEHPRGYVTILAVLPTDRIGGRDKPSPHGSRGALSNRLGL